MKSKKSLWKQFKSMYINKEQKIEFNYEKDT